MENFVVSARKYRPSTFDSVVGQNSITNTLKNAIKTSHLTQAFLFCGPRGVGKTTCARILAKTINCFNRTENIEACNNCDSCNSFNEGASLNIYELDAASNNSVDDIRSLTDQVRIAPQIGSHKVYIIDEVHMLSPQAFNAFLKTLEEPPAHAIFILATTEKHKIIPTILSRCQIFDFNRISIQDISLHLASIAKQEKVNAEPEALQIIAEKADGALRDSLSIFDQLVSFAGNNLTYKAVIENLNILDYDYYFKCTDYLLAGQISPSLLLFNEILKKGFDGQLFINGIAAHFRNLMVCKDPETVVLLEVGPSVEKSYLEQAKKASLDFLLPALEICRTCDNQYRASKNQRLLVELSLMQLASILSETNSLQKKKPSIKQPDSAEALVEDKETVVEPEIPNLPENPVNEELPAQQTAAPKKEEKKISEKPQEKRAPLNLGISSKTSGFSIKELTNQNAAEEDGEAEEFHSALREEIDQETFLKVWKELAEHIKEANGEGSSMVYAGMTSREPELDKNFHIHVKVDNLSQQEEIGLKRTDIHAFLRKKLRNGAIELHTSIIKDKKEKKAYTPEEKFNKLAEVNPILIKLKKELDLDFF